MGSVKWNLAATSVVAMVPCEKAGPLCGDDRVNGFLAAARRMQGMVYGLSPGQDNHFQGSEQDHIIYKLPMEHEVPSS